MNKEDKQHNDSLPENQRMKDLRTELKKILVKEFSGRLTQNSELTEEQRQGLCELILNEGISTVEILRILQN